MHRGGGQPAGTAACGVGGTQRALIWQEPERRRCAAGSCVEAGRMRSGGMRQAGRLGSGRGSAEASPVRWGTWATAG